jgi:hypothetical protein
VKTLLFPLLALLGWCFLSTPSHAQGYPPYHDISDAKAAEAEAQTRHLPLAWVGGFNDDLKVEMPDTGSEAELTQMALSTLEDEAVVIFFDGHNMGVVPDLVHAQDHIADDGPLPGGASWNVPKIVFTDPAVTRALGRVSATQLVKDRDTAIKTALAAIRANPNALVSVPPPGIPAATAVSSPFGSPVPAPVPAPAPVAGTDTPPPAYGTPAQANAAPPAPSPPAAAAADPSSPGDDIDMTPDELQISMVVQQYGIVIAGAAMLIVILSLATWRQPGSPRAAPMKRGRY